MGDYLYRTVNAMLSSEFVPAFVRMKVMHRIGFKFGHDVCIWPKGSFRSRKVTIGNNVFINVGFFYDGHDTLTIGNAVRIGQFVRVITATHDIGPSEQRGKVEVVGKPVRISDGCWIGTGVTILPGVTIDKGCVIASNAVVTRSTEADGLYAGIPARRVRDLDGSPP